MVTIDALVDKFVHEQEVAKEALEEHVQLYFQMARAHAREALGNDLFEAIDPLLDWNSAICDVKAITQTAGQVQVPVLVKKVIEAKVAPFSVLFNLGYGYVQNTDDGEMVKDWGIKATLVDLNGRSYLRADATKFFGWQRDRFNTWHEQWLSTFLAKYKQKLAAHPNASNVTIEEAEDAYRYLVDNAPEMADKWGAMLDYYRERRKQWEEAELLKQREKQELDAEYDEYERRMYEYYIEQLKITQSNKEKLAAFQRLLDKEFEFYKVTYALVAEEEGDKFVETKSLYANDCKPDEDGFWPIWKSGEITRVIFMHVVSVERVYRRPTCYDNNLFRYKRLIDYDDQGFWHHPDEDLDDFPSFIDSLTMPLDEPVAPGKDRWRDDMAASRARGMAMAAIKTTNDDELPF